MLYFDDKIDIIVVKGARGLKHEKRAEDLVHSKQYLLVSVHQ